MDVYAFAMIAYELFETRKPFGNLHPLEAAQRACVEHARPQWGKLNGCAPSALRQLNARPRIFKIAICKE